MVLCATAKRWVGWGAAAVVGALALAACGGKALHDDEGESGLPRGSEAEPGAPAPGQGGDGAGGGSGVNPSEWGGIGGYQFMLAEDCDACSWERGDERCSSLVTEMPFIEDPAYYECFTQSQDFALCLDALPAFCISATPERCPTEHAALTACLSGL